MNQLYFVTYQAAMILSLLVSVFVIALLWRHRQASGAVAMIALAASVFIWTLGFLLESNSYTLEWQLFFNNIGYIGSMSVPVAWIIFSLQYTQDNRAVAWKYVLLFTVIPLITIALVWTNSWHHLLWYNEHLITSGPFTITDKTYAPLLWVAFAYSYILVIAGAVILLRRLFVGAPLYRRQAVSLIAAVGLPLIWHVIYIFNLIPQPRKDLTPLMFALSGIAITLGLMRFRMFTVMPIARKFLIEQLSDGILFFDMSNRLLEVNPAAMTIFNIDQKSIGKDIEYPSLLSLVRERFSPTGYGWIDLSLTVSGEDRMYELGTVPTRDKRDVQVGWLAILRDVTDRKRQEMEYRTIIQTTGDGFFILDMEGRFLDVNDAYCSIVGYSRSELLDLKISDIEAVETPEETAAHIARIKETGVDRFETRHHHKDGSAVDVEVSTNFIEFGGGRTFVFIRDITENKKLQEQLIAQDRLASIGELTTGIAHELNNPLASVLGFSDLLLRRDIPADVKADLTIINSEAERAARIVDNLLAFARRQPEDEFPASVNEIVEKTLELRTYEQKLKNIRVQTQFTSDLPQIKGNDFQLRQVFLNIIINAEFFMIEAHGEGTLVIRTEQAGDFIRISFIDDGPGIPRENLVRLFSPFFTTKEIGKGTGLGLSICHGIIAAHGGRIWAESEFGDGTSIIVELPVYTGKERESEQQPVHQ